MEAATRTRPCAGSTSSTSWCRCRAGSAPRRRSPSGAASTSVKLTEADLLGRPVRVLRVKGSGSDLKSVGRRDFPGVRLPEVLALLERDDVGDQEMVDYLARCLQEPGSPRPSIETLLHGFLDAEAVIHTHADAIVGLTNTERGRDVVEDLFGKETCGCPTGGRVPAVEGGLGGDPRAQPEAQGIVLEKHGLSTRGATLKEAYLATIELVTRAEAGFGARGRRVFGAPVVATPDLETRRRVAREIRFVLHAGCWGASGVWCCASTTATTSSRSRGRPRPRGSLRWGRPPRPHHLLEAAAYFVPLVDSRLSDRCRRRDARRSTGSWRSTRRTSRPTVTASSCSPASLRPA